MSQLYTLDDSISDFFKSQASVSRHKCDALAISLVDEPLVPVPIQGAFSYTVAAGRQQAQIVQFQAQSSILNIDVLELVRKIHGGVVAQCYVIEKLPGLTYIEARFIHGVCPDPSEIEVRRQENDAQDFARFFAQSWQNLQSMAPEVIRSQLREYQLKIDLLSQALPQCFTKILSKLRSDLPILFAEGFLLVIRMSFLV
ncbi:hypothetical protein AJ78_02727 [Emergomyces pasteurianus Ep9510]|uniref:Uncharacterized protein n=1 Tax=Emergomyces pasteurianus Ep9510 TaxID=1447872 RepID=A0A1J9QLY0_9EURO|nr:hypothetical protein AJ78_02727 [Emergomyces pasteurianus Ep9510]